MGRGEEERELLCAVVASADRSPWIRPRMAVLWRRGLAASGHGLYESAGNGIMLHRVYGRLSPPHCLVSLLRHLHTKG